VHSTNRTTALIRSVRNEGLRRAYSGRGTPPHGPDDPGAAPDGASLYRRLLNAWNGTPTKWYPLPLAVGALLLVAMQLRRRVRGGKEVLVDDEGVQVIKLKGPWQVHVLGALPLRNMSRLWGYCNSFELPIWFRPYGFRLYAVMFGCNLDEIDAASLTDYASLGEFFYRKLKAGTRPVDNATLVSPADGKVLHFGTIKNRRVEQVKGITYSLDALLGVERAAPGPRPSVPVVASSNRDMEVVDDHEFANINDIEYSLDQLLGAPSPASTPGHTTPVSELPAPAVPPTKYGAQVDASVLEPARSLTETLAHDTSVALELGVAPAGESRRRSASADTVKAGNALFFAVIYLAPGDYHRFHSPTAWVVEKRRHFVGELFSVSPYMAKRLENLFVLNERVALLGRWKHGFFSMVPVGATNVGSIKINFDQALRTNVRGRPPPPGTYSEAVYSAASPILHGQPLAPAQEMGGFCLGSTIVLVFEAPREFEFSVQTGQRIKVGQRLGDVPAKEKVE
jgi:phosphatidylserine decarboxylase